MQRNNASVEKSMVSAAADLDALAEHDYRLVFVSNEGRFD